MSTYKEIKRVSIMGCGWLGVALGEHLIAKGIAVKGSTTKEERLSILKESGIEPYLIRLLPDPEGDDLQTFLDTDLLIISLPPAYGQSSMETYHAAQINNVKDAVENLPIDKVIYISSTSIYPDNNKKVNENSEVKKDTHSKRIILAEEELRINTQLDATILRVGGLMGYDRIPIKYFTGKTVDTGHIPVNFVHRDDVVGVIDRIIMLNDKNAWNKVYNVVAPKHPTRQVLYLKNAKDYGYEPPEFVSGNKPYKVVNSDKLLNKLGYKFKYPDPLDFPYDPKVD